jgi:hypothetical protein
MPLTREVAFGLQRAGVVEVRQRGARVAEESDVDGPIRIARGRHFV